MNKVYPSYYSVITADVRYDKRLSPAVKIFYSEITALCNMNGCCNVSNSYFSELYEVDISTIKRWIKMLSGYGYIRVAYNIGKASNERKIYLNFKEKIDDSNVMNLDVFKKFYDSI